MKFFDCSPKELVTINQSLEPKLAWAKTRVAETEQMALDATRLLSCTEERLNDYVSQGFFKRCWKKLCGKQGEMMRANQKDLTEMQKYAWRYINLLNERDLLMAHSLITVKNNLMTLAIAQEETRNEIARMAEKVYERFIDLENRVKHLEISTNIHSWLLTLDTYDYDEKYSPHFRMLKIIRDFMELKDGDWNIRDIKYLQQAIKLTGLPWKEKIKISDFIYELIDEIEESSFLKYQKLLLLPYDHSDSFIPGTFVLENIPAPSFASLYQISDNYAVSSAIIDALAEQLNISKKEAMKKVMTSFIAKQGIDLEVSVPLRDLAVELLGCMKLTKNFFDFNNIDQSQRVHEDKKSTTVSVDEDISDEEKDLDWYMKAAEQGDAESQCRLGYIYYGEKDYEKAFEWFSKAVEQGYAKAQYKLGNMYYYGKGVEKNYEKAFEWYIKAAEQDNADAYNAIGYFYNEVKQNKNEAFKWYMKAAKRDCVSGQFNVGNCYKSGDGVEKNEKKAFEWFMKAAKQDDADAFNAIGYFYNFGYGVEKDEKKAFKWYMKAAKKDCVYGQFNVGNCYYYGRGVEKNYQKAFEWFMKAAEQNYAVACRNVALCYKFGIGVEKNEVESLKWYKKAAENGDLIAIVIHSFTSTISKLNYNKSSGDLWIEGDNMDYEKLEKAGQAYAGDLADNALVLWDSTVFGSAKEGFLITKDLQIVSHLDKIPLSLKTDTPQYDVIYKMKFFNGKEELKKAVAKLAELAKKHGCV